MTNESRVLIVSNRLPVTVERLQGGDWKLTRSGGGLAAGLREVHQRSDSLWIGHAGTFEGDGDAALTSRLAEERLVPVPLDADDYDAYYNGLSNGTLWPLFHYRTAQFQFSDWEAYEAVNERFAETVIGLTRPGDRVWVHDYHLMLLPALLRARDPSLRIAYFHHVPFCSSDVFRMLASREAILRGVLGADLVGFHTIDYVRHFAVSITRILGLETHLDSANYQGRVVKVGAFPLGVDAETIEGVASGPEVAEEVSLLRAGLAGQTVFLGVDRLDYTKGISERLGAFATLLRKHPELAGRCVLVQVCVPSREEVLKYAQLRSEVERLVGQINGELGVPGYMPVHYLHRSVPLPELIALYRVADVALVTPLRDGLNLVCKEYVAARSDYGGVLVLSEFAGAAAEMGEALLVNPYDPGALVRAMRDAVMMPEEERRSRMRCLRERTLQHDNLDWARTVLSRWEEACQRDAKQSDLLTDVRREALARDVAEAPRAFMFLDHDGTLTPIAARPELALPSAGTIELLASLAVMPATEITVVTGRPRDFCDRFFGELPINLAAEHGAWIRLRDGSGWQPVADAGAFDELRIELRRVLDHYTRCLPGAFVEEKEVSIVWHYRQAEPMFARHLALELVETLGRLLRSTPYAIFSAHKAIEVRAEIATKGHAVSRLLEVFDCQDTDAVFAAGDDTSDEDMYRIRREQNLSVHVGRPSAASRFHLESPAAMHQVLRDIRKARGPRI